MSESETDMEFVSDMEWLHSHDREAALPPEKMARLFALARRGAHLCDTARSLGWPDDGAEGAFEFITRRTREVALEDARRGAEAGWRPIEEAPRDGTRVLLAYRNSLQKWRRVIAFYAPKFKIEQDAESDWFEYDEANDRYCLPEGWYECVENWDEYAYVHMSGVKPTHFMPLPPPPQENE